MGRARVGRLDGGVLLHSRKVDPQPRLLTLRWWAALQAPVKSRVGLGESQRALPTLPRRWSKQPRPRQQASSEKNSVASGGK